MIEFVSGSEGDTEKLGARIAQALRSRAPERAGSGSVSAGALVALYGGLGMGKTAFTRGFARALGFAGRVTSPTFAIMNEYPCGGFSVYHFDLYRISSPDELFDVGFDDALDACQNGSFVVTEWSESMDEGSARGVFTVRVEFRRGADDNSREISVSGVEI